MNVFKITAKFLLALLSWIPLVWTMVLLVASYGYGYSTPGESYSIKNNLRDFLVSFAELYIPAGFIMWLVFLVWLSIQKIISAKRRNFYIVLMLAGILCAMLALSYDVFGVSGVYLD